VTALTGLYVQQLATGPGATARSSRLALAGLLAKNPDGTVKTGVLVDGQGPVVTGTAGMSYSIRSHVAVTKVSEANGPTLVPNDGTVVLATDPAPGSNSRIDTIWVRQQHIEGDGGTGTTINTPEFGVAKGAASATPAKPSVPTGALELASVPVTAGTTATSGLTFTQAASTTANYARPDDTDWMPLTLPAGFTSPTGIKYLVEGRSVYLSGVVVRTGGWPAGSGQPYALFPSLPALIRPVYDVNLAATMDWNGIARIAVETSGALTLVHYSGTPGFISLSAQWIRKV
jgi:hypothetical protein